MFSKDANKLPLELEEKSQFIICKLRNSSVGVSCPIFRFWCNRFQGRRDGDIVECCCFL